MKELKSILKSILLDLQNNSDSVTVINHEHIIDNLSGVEYHLYDDYFHMTRNGERVTESFFTKDTETETGERSIIRQIKGQIADNKKMQFMNENYEQYLMDGRKLFSSWYENPEPIDVKPEPAAEQDAEEYIRH